MQNNVVRDHDAWPSLVRVTNLKKQKIEHEYSNKTYLWYDNNRFIMPITCNH